MSFLFGRARTRTNTLDLSKQAKEHVTKLDVAGKAEELAKVLSQMKLILQGTPESDSTPEQVYQLVQGLIEEDLLLLLAQNLWRLPFESRKDTQVIFSYVFRFRPPTASPKTDPVALSYVVNNKPQVLLELCRGYEHKESATPAVSVLREVLKNEAAAAIVLFDDGEELGSSTKGVTAIERDRLQSGNGVFWRFFDWIDKSSFEGRSRCVYYVPGTSPPLRYGVIMPLPLTNHQELLTRHKELVPRYLSVNFELFFDKYNHILVQSNSYVTKRQSIKLLGEILLDRSNYNVMTAYVDRGEHLKICMNLLRDDRKMVQYEGFHVFKVFVANPHKSIAVQKILIMNRDKLLNFLSHFLEDRTDDEQFIDEREFLIKQIRNLPPTPIPPTRQMSQGV